MKATGEQEDMAQAARNGTGFDSELGLKPQIV